ncbi:MAG: amidohydrolase family protein, partial [Candidatus Cloacimonetes bacterium]|nr:amidohydrolase family protein [Candidatus Cloacimonadota bacterium]
ENADKYEFYKQMIEENELKLRVCWHFPSERLDQMIANKTISYTGDERLKIGGMKIFMDGSLGSQSAWMFDPYQGTENTGMPLMSEEELYSLVKKGVDNGISSTVHGIGDRCNHVILSVFDRIRRETGETSHHRIEHLQCIRKEDFQLIKDNRVYCAVQPVHIKSDVANIKRYWAHCMENVYPFKSLKDYGISMGFGSDAPVETINPFEGIFAAVERKYLNNPEDESWQPMERLSLSDALSYYTIEAAKGSCSEEFRGTITEGKSADLIVIEKLPGLVSETKDYSAWLEAETKLTMINGEIVRNLLEMQ